MQCESVSVTGRQCILPAGHEEGEEGVPHRSTATLLRADASGMRQEVSGVECVGHSLSAIQRAPIITLCISHTQPFPDPFSVHEANEFGFESSLGTAGLGDESSVPFVLGKGEGLELNHGMPTKRIAVLAVSMAGELTVIC